MKENKNTQRIKKLTALAVFAALAYVLHFIHIPVMFLNLDFKDVVTAIAGMYFGPISGLCLSVLVPLLEYPTSGTREYGLIMNILSSASFVVTASTVYRFKKTFFGAIMGLVSAVFAMVAVMMMANLFITPFYMGMPRSEIVAWIPKLFLPFNAVKGVLNASLVLCFYKPITQVLKRAGFARRTSEVIEGDVLAKKSIISMRTILVWIIAGAIAIASLVIIFTILGGKLAFN